MDTIIMYSNILVVKKILSKTSAKMFKNLKIGDQIILSIPVQSAGSNRGTYASYIKIKNMKTNEVASCSFNQILARLKCFVLEEGWHE